LYEIWEP